MDGLRSGRGRRRACARPSCQHWPQPITKIGITSSNQDHKKNNSNKYTEEEKSAGSGGEDSSEGGRYDAYGPAQGNNTAAILRHAFKCRQWTSR